MLAGGGGLSIKGDGGTRQINSNLTGHFNSKYSHTRGLKGLIAGLQVQLYL